jgi:hypothetical protein
MYNHDPQYLIPAKAQPSVADQLRRLALLWPNLTRRQIRKLHKLAEALEYPSAQP